MLRQLPNAISLARLLAVPVLFVLALLEHERAFGWVLVPALLTDIFDGLIARLYHLESRLGAILDSVADELLMIVSAYGLWVFHHYLFEQYGAFVWTALGLWLLESLVSLLRYGRLSSFHTYASKVAANVLGLFVIVLFVLGFQPWLFYAAMCSAILASVEELALIAVLPKWRADVRGLWWVMQE